MNAKQVKQSQAIGTQQVVRQDRPVPTPRQRLHASIERLLSLDKQLDWDQLEQAELLDGHSTGWLQGPAPGMANTEG
jgi:hypothetical protein